VIVLASVPINAEGGSYMTFGAPIVLFCIVAGTLWVLFARPHRRVPPRRVLAGASAVPGEPGAQAVSAPPAGSGSVSGAATVPTDGATATGTPSADGGTQPEQSTPSDGTEASE
jgi:hypothetical protein